MNLYRNYIKRLLDIIFSLVALIVLSPVLLFTALLIRKNLGSPVIFSQNRPGKDEKIFKLYKFRSMTDERDELGELLPDSERLPKFGQILRSTSLDELPELWNILKGDMSIVGPRPLLIRYLPYYTTTEQTRHKVRPGLTGLAQIKGRNNLGWNTRLSYDTEYAKNLSFILDIKIIFNTIHKVLKRDDITVVDKGTLESLDIERKSQLENKRHEN